ncbi:unnamed protein product [Prunus brigantina]
MRLLIHLIPFLSLFPAYSLLSRLSPKRHVHLTTPTTTTTIHPSANSALFSSLFALTAFRRRKKMQNLLTCCLFSVEGNDEAILSWSFYVLANNKVSWPCDFEFTSKFIGQQTHEPRADWQVEKFGDLSKSSVHGRVALSIVKLVPNIKYLNLKAAKVNRDGLVTLLCGCKDLVMLDARDCSSFDENDDEISKLASHISKFMCKGF